MLKVHFGADKPVVVGQLVAQNRMDFKKIVWDGKTILLEMQNVELIKDSFRVRFTKEADPATMKKENINITQWWCTYSQVYGSPIMGFKSPEIGSLSLSEDKKTLAVKIPVQEKQVFCLDLAKLLRISPV